MRICHWTLTNGSGMHRVAQDLCAAEVAIGLDSVVVNSQDEAEWERGEGAGIIHVNHSHVPDPIRAAGGKIIWIGHGTPEHCFQQSVELGLNAGYGASDTWMLVNYWLQHADACVTFWPRHKAIWGKLADKNTKIYEIPLGINPDYWKEVEVGKYAGTPSIFSAENCHYIKWPLDLVLAWSWVTDAIPDARLHMAYIPLDQHKWWYPLLQRTGTHFKAYIGGTYDHDTLKQVFSGCDFYMNPVKYGDYNRIGLEAKSTGCKVISFEGNPFADFWISEGDQRKQAKQMIEILSGQVAPRESKPVPTVADMAKGMLEVYGAIK